MRTTTIDPLCEKYYSISPYAWCGNNPVRNVDLDGRDYWSTSDTELIRDFFNSMGSGLNSHDFSRWNHVEDSKFIKDYKATFNDETGKFYTSYGTVEDGIATSVGVTIDTNISPGLNSFGWPYQGLQVYPPVGDDLGSKISHYVFGKNATYDVGQFSWNVNTSGRVIGVQPLTGIPDLIGGRGTIKAGKFIQKMGKAKGNMSASRIVQNNEAKRIAKELGLKTEKEKRLLHDLISGQGYSYDEALKEAKAFFGK